MWRALASQTGGLLALKAASGSPHGPPCHSRCHSQRRLGFAAPDPAASRGPDETQETDHEPSALGRTTGLRATFRHLSELRMAHGIRVSRKRVERLMVQAGISGLVPRRRGRTMIRVPGVRVADDLVLRDFRPAAPNVLWVADITYLRSWESWVYLAAVQDAFSRTIVGWAMAEHMRLSCLRPEGPRRRHCDLDGLAGRLLRQRRRRVALRHPEDGARPPPLLADSA